LKIRQAYDTIFAFIFKKTKIMVDNPLLDQKEKNKRLGVPVLPFLLIGKVFLPPKHNRLKRV
jgi:hypothetical protein